MQGKYKDFLISFNPISSDNHRILIMFSIRADKAPREDGFSAMFFS